VAAPQQVDGIVNRGLFERLRALRRQLADKEGVPAYVVFSDATLRDMARQVPRSVLELRSVSGVGPAKIARYGEVFLEVLRAWS
jgi:ATP-dependent DNA helicase RecQ